MSAYRNFAVVGPGRFGSLGKLVTQNLLQAKAAGKVDNIVLLTRAYKSSLDAFIKQGVKVAVVDYDDKATLRAALAGVDVVISTLSILPPALDIQQPLVDAAKDAGVRLFIPSEYGHPTNRGHTAGVWGAKARVQNRLKELQLPYALFWTGIWSDYIFEDNLGLDTSVEKGKVIVAGDGNALNSFTAPVDIARFIVHVVLSLPPKDLEWRVFRIEGERTSFNAVISEYEKRSGRKLTVIYRPLEEVKEAARNPDDFVNNLFADYATGGSIVADTSELDNHLYPDWNPKRVIDVLLPSEL